MMNLQHLASRGLRHRSSTSPRESNDRRRGTRLRMLAHRGFTVYTVRKKTRASPRPEEKSMAQPYRIFGNELSPYSVKVRSYFRYKQIPHEWIIRSGANQAEFQKYAKLPLVPLVVSPGGEAI